MNPLAILNNTLNVDRNLRMLNLIDNNDLFNLEKIDFDKNWLFEKPTIVPKAPLCIKIESSSQFRKIFKQHFNFLANINFNNIMIAGGFCCSILLDLPVNDIDLFVHSLKKSDANYLIYDTINIIINNTNKLNKTYKIINSQNSLTIIVDNIKIQIIYRLYKSKSEILHGFDLGSSAVGFDGKKIYLTSLGKFSYEYGYNIIDLTRRSTTYEKRLLKYLERGFGIIMPAFDMNIIDLNYIKYGLEYLLDLPYLKITIADVKYNQLYVRKCCSNQSDQSDYADYNKRRLINVSDNNIYSFSDFMDYSTKIYVIDGPIIDIQNKIIDLKSISSINKNKIIRFANNLYISKPKWIIDNPGTQLTSSINPIITEPIEWYGPYYQPELVPLPGRNYNYYLFAFLGILVIIFIMLFVKKVFQ